MLRLWGEPMRRAVRIALKVICIAAATALAWSASLVPTEASTAPAVATANWPAYLHGPAHSSFSPGQRTITPANVGALVVKWRFQGGPPPILGQPRRGFLASPTVADGAIYIGSVTGWFYKLSAVTGRVLAK